VYKSASSIPVRIVCAAASAAGSDLRDLREVLVYVLHCQCGDDDEFSVAPPSSFLSSSVLMCEVVQWLKAADVGLPFKCICVCDCPSAADVLALPSHVGKISLTALPISKATSLSAAAAGKRGSSRSKSPRAPLKIEVDCPVDSAGASAPMSTGAWIDQLFSPQGSTGVASSGFGRAGTAASGAGAVASNMDVVDVYNNYFIVEGSISGPSLGLNSAVEELPKARSVKGRRKIPVPVPKLRDAYELFMQSAHGTDGKLPDRVSQMVLAAAANHIVCGVEAYYLQLLLASVQISMEFGDGDDSGANLTCAVPLSIVHHISAHATLFAVHGDQYGSRLYTLLGTIIVCYALTLQSYVHSRGTVSG
jgi:hypothetical protein